MHIQGTGNDGFIPRTHAKVLTCSQSSVGKVSGEKPPVTIVSLLPPFLTARDLYSRWLIGRNYTVIAVKVCSNSS